MRALDGEIGWAKARLVAPEHYEAEARRAKRRSGISAPQVADVVTGDPRRVRALDGEIGWAKARLVAPEHYEAEARRAKRRSGISAPQVADVFALRLVYSELLYTISWKPVWVVLRPAPPGSWHL